MDVNVLIDNSEEMEMEISNDEDYNFKTLRAEGIETLKVYSEMFSTSERRARKRDKYYKIFLYIVGGVVLFTELLASLFPALDTLNKSVVILQTVFVNIYLYLSLTQVSEQYGTAATSIEQLNLDMIDCDIHVFKGLQNKFINAKGKCPVIPTAVIKSDKKYLAYEKV